MSAYTTAFQALTDGRPLRPGEAAQLLANLRQETGEELAQAIEKQLDGKFRRTEDDTSATFRKKRAQYGASMRIVNALRALAQATRPTFPHQRNNRSTS
ncbi:hypothetical protein JHN52_01270 [Streptomyces sp. MBT97]|uniref:hypothetical protein n=1 Tax=Streptomyces sp. MBT97 TaxID=2800411 RepID=UPI00190AE1D4|nr:hypothetical protein [Streptomyces sp. MBT97]MBK3631611.1 hypothetical protein [Streptomyces sp. MBT97]